MRLVAAIWTCALLLAGGASAAHARTEIRLPRPTVPQPDLCDRGDVCVTSQGAAIIEVPAPANR